MSFYRIYRPQVFNEIDNIAVRQSLLSLLAKPKNELPHAYLFSGPRGGGKTTAARLVAKLFNCQKLTKSGPCGVCDQCKTIAEGRNLDVLELDAASNRGIDEIRTLRDGIALAPVSADFKVYIIDEVHMLTTEAFNALLKTLEEPPKHAIFVLATTDPQKVPVTITSRCTPITFTRASTAELTSALSRIVKKEKMDIDQQALAIIATSVDGSFRDAVKLLEQVSFHTGAIHEQTIQSMLSLTSTVDIVAFNDALLAQDAKGCLHLIQKFVGGGADVKALLVQSLAELHTRMLADTANKKIAQAIRKLSVAYTELRSASIPQLPIELAVVEYCDTGLPSVQEEPKTEKKEESKELGSLTLEKLLEHWTDIIGELKPFNHSIAAVMRSTRPATVKDGIVTIEAFYTFHKDKLSENKTRETIAAVLKKLFGEQVKVEIVLGKK